MRLEQFISEVRRTHGNAISEPRQWHDVFPQLAASDHVVHFCSSSFETESNMFDYLEHNLQARTDAKVACLCRSSIISGMKDDLAKRGFKKDIRSNRLAFIPYELLMENMIRDRNVEKASEVFQTQLDSYFDEGYSSIRFGGLLAGSLFSLGHYGLTRDWEAYLHKTAQKIDLAIYCPYPAPSQRINFDALKKVASTHNWIATDDNAYRTNLVLS